MMDDDNIHNIATTAACMAAGLPRGDELTELLDLWGCGYLEIVQELTRYALIGERWMMDGCIKDFPGVYDYEVSEPFGEWFTDFVLTSENNMAPTMEVGTAKLRELYDAFFAQRTA